MLGELSMRILVADEQSKVRFALGVLLGRQPGLEIVGEAADTGDLLVQTRASQPDLVLLHWGLQGSNGRDLLPALREACPGVSIIVLSAQPDLRQGALRAGADAFVSKCEPPECLLEAIRSVT